MQSSFPSVIVCALGVLSLWPQPVASQTGGSAEATEGAPGQGLVSDYLHREAESLAAACLSDVRSMEEWTERRVRYRDELFEMLGLAPRPERTPLRAEITGRLERSDFRVEKLHFQSLPGLYVTGNLYLPRGEVEAAPAILYVCGHGRVKKGDVSYGNKAHYQHHGAWFARHGYVCLMIDTLQLGEIEGTHHGTYRYGMWWWNARGYTPAGVEAWNSIRALDYLTSRPEVDAERIGVTGRSGGGAYSWWVAALDDRIKVAVPVAGITSLKNHVIDGCVEGHCDCMYMVNTYRWDYAQVAALVAPRPLLISNSDKDGIFPLDGVVDIYNQVRGIYELHDKLDHIGLQITEGPHKDTQELRIHAFRWFNRFLKETDELIEKPAIKFFEPESLKVFDSLPEDSINAEAHETFTPRAETPAPPPSAAAWEIQRDRWLAALRSKCFAGWPTDGATGNDSHLPLRLENVSSDVREGIALDTYDFESQSRVRLRLYTLRSDEVAAEELDLVVLNALDDAGWNEFAAMMSAGFPGTLGAAETPQPDAEAFTANARMLKSFKWGMAYVAPRGVGPTAWNPDERNQTHIRRRFMLLGQTLDSMRVWDLRRGVQALRRVEGFARVPLWLQAERQMAGAALYASLFEPRIARLDLHELPRSHRDGPIFLNVLRILDVPQAVALAAERSRVRIYQTGAGGWEYPLAVAARLGWDEKRLQVREPAPGE